MRGIIEQHELRRQRALRIDRGDIDRLRPRYLACRQRTVWAEHRERSEQREHREHRERRNDANDANDGRGRHSRRDSRPPARKRGRITEFPHGAWRSRAFRMSVGEMPKRA